jgi:hypothetical protein
MCGAILSRDSPVRQARRESRNPKAARPRALKRGRHARRPLVRMLALPRRALRLKLWHIARYQHQRSPQRGLKPLQCFSV